jgi:hypothetical protein
LKLASKCFVFERLVTFTSCEIGAATAPTGVFWATHAVPVAMVAEAMVAEATVAEATVGVAARLGHA